MILPENGSVVVVDDQVNEAMPLLQSLAKKHIPAIYFEGGNPDALPEIPLKNIRLLFLDLNLTKRISNDEQSIKSSLFVNIKKIVSEENGPYVLVVWSTKEDLYSNILDKLFGNSLKSLKPSIKLSLSKGNYFKRNEKNKLVPKQDFLEKLDKKIKEELQNLGSLTLLMAWQNIINGASGEIIRELTSFYDDHDNWNENLSELFKRLAKARLEDHLDATDVPGIAKNCLFTLNGTFADVLASGIRNRDFSGLELQFKPTEENKSSQKPKKKKKQEPTFHEKREREISSKINSKLHLEKDIEDSLVQPGNIYSFDSDWPEGIRMDAKTICGKDVWGSISEQNIKLEHVFIEVTPYCDFSNRKFSMYRLLPGVLWPVEFDLKSSLPANIYDSPSFFWDGRCYKIVFDFKYLQSLPTKDFNPGPPYFRIRSGLLFDIQSKMANHISRPGVISVV